MDVLHLTTAHGPTDTRIFDKEASSSVERGFDVGILAHGTPTESRGGVEFFDLGLAQTRIERWRSIPKAARTAKRLNASVYHFHDPELIPVGLYLAETTEGAVVYDVHENFGQKIAGREWIPTPIARPAERLYPRVELSAASRFDAVVAATTEIEARFTDAVEHTATVHNFPRIEAISTQPEPIHRRADHVLCYVGGLSELRGIHRALELLATLRSRGTNAELWALGNWRTDADRERAETYIEDRSLEPWVQFPGYLDYAKMFDYLYSADVGLSLLDTEEFQRAIPTKQFEYLYAGLPIVTTPLDAAIRFLPDRFRCVVPQGDTAATADAVERAFESSYDTAEMQALVRDSYSWESEAETLTEVYTRLLW
ncbi:glycosyltransferase [Halosegnis longus]|uniref:glycosyltransferase n=1 Tax=Halosegnis longus TaxID=2216012 RepID=UPI00096A7712|nr:glycosyltransferase family 4 protein [Salella cibi]